MIGFVTDDKWFLLMADFLYLFLQGASRLLPCYAACRLFVAAAAAAVVVAGARF